VEALARLAQHVLLRHPDVLEVEAAQVVAAEAHRVEAFPHFEAVHARLEDQRDVPVLAAHLCTGEGDEHRPLAAVADVALLAVEQPRPVRLLNRARLQVVGIRPRVRLRQGERRQLATARQVRQEALLLLVAAEQHDALHPDRLVHAHDHRQRSVGLGELLEHAAVAGLRKPGAAVLLGHVEAGQAALAQLGDLVVADPALLLDGVLVVALAELARRLHEPAHLLLLLGVRLRIGEDELLVDLPEEERLGERGDAVKRLARLLGGGRLHQAAAG
jgi:hypothetical protein